MNPQEALDAPWFCILPPPGGVALEDGISKSTITKLRAIGHDVVGPVAGHERCTGNLLLYSCTPLTNLYNKNIGIEH